jgi:hypothetical protein
MKARGPPTKMALERVRKLGQGNFGVAVLARLDGMHDTELFVLAVCERCLAGRWHVQRVFFQNVVCFVSHPRNRDHGLPGRVCVCVCVEGGGCWHHGTTHPTNPLRSKPHVLSTVAFTAHSIRQATRHLV